MLHMISISGSKRSLTSQSGSLHNQIANYLARVNILNGSEIPGDLPCDPRGSQGMSGGLIGDLLGDLHAISSLSPLDLGTTKKCSNGSVNIAIRKT